MYLRCPSCNQSFRVGGEGDDRTAICIGCGRALSLMRRGRLGPTLEERSNRALRYSQTHEIDLASAYSVLLGIMTLPQARSIIEQIPAVKAEDLPEEPKDAAAPADADRGGGRRVSYDPGFHKAVASGRLSIRQAMERGDRVMYASRIAQEHGLTLNEAFLVSDNRMSVADALAAKAKNALQETAAAAARTGFSAKVWLGLGFMLMVSLVAWSASILVGNANWEEARARVTQRPLGPPPAITTETEVRLNPVGEIVSVQGLDPDKVLEAYCHAGRGVIRRPVRVTDSDDDAKVGIFRQDGAMYSVPIRKEDGNHWKIGNGREPIVPATGNHG